MKTDSGWIFSKREDISLFVLPIVFSFFFTLFLITTDMELNINPTVTLFFALLIDYPHIFSTLFVTYLDTKMQKTRRPLLINCLLASTALILIIIFFFQQNYDHIFVFLNLWHFTRQDIGWVAISSKKGFQGGSLFIEKLTIYTQPLLYLVFYFKNKGPVLETLYIFNNPDQLDIIISIVYLCITLLFPLKELYYYLKTKKYNLAKSLFWFSSVVKILLGFYFFQLSPLFAASYLILQHGLPYMYLVKKYRIDHKEKEPVKFLNINFDNWKKAYGLCLVLALLVSPMSLLSQYLPKTLLYFLTIPVFTHYIIDGFLWNRSKANEDFHKFIYS